METFASFLRKIANNTFWQDKIKEKFGISCACKEPGGALDPIILRQTYLILSTMPVELIKNSGTTQFFFSNSLGPSRPYYPNHGYFYPGDGSITLNNDIFYHPDYPDDFYDDKGYRLGRPYQTLGHEMAHSFDEKQGKLSLKPEWTSLSGWSPVPRPGLKRMVINEPGMPVKIGEWYYDPKAKFGRYYGKMAPWEDFADGLIFFVAGMKSKLPDNKNAYFDKLLKKYY
jgi:hypothetical protein